MRKIICILTVCLTVFLCAVPVFASDMGRAVAEPIDPVTFNYWNYATGYLEQSYSMTRITMGRSAFKQTIEMYNQLTGEFLLRVDGSNEIRGNDWLADDLYRFRVTPWGVTGSVGTTVQNCRVLDLAFIPEGTVFQFSGFNLDTSAGFGTPSVQLDVAYYDMYGNVVARDSQKKTYTPDLVFQHFVPNYGNAIYFLVQIAVRDFSVLNDGEYQLAFTNPEWTIFMDATYFTENVKDRINVSLGIIQDSIGDIDLTLDEILGAINNAFGSLDPDNKPQFDQNLDREDELLEGSSNAILGFITENEIFQFVAILFSTLVSGFALVEFLFSSLVAIPSILGLVYCSIALGFIGLLIGFVILKSR